VSDVIVVYAGIHTNEESVVHNHVGVIQVTHNAMGDILIRRVTEQVAAE
jgi:hypothetical protein